MQTNTRDNSDHAALRAVLDQWTTASQGRDLDAVMACYASDVVAYDAIQALQFTGREAYRAHWRMCLDMCPAGLSFHLRDLVTHAEGDVGYAHGLLACSDGVSGRDFWSRLSTVFRRDAGRWLIVHEHISFPFDPQTSKAMMHLQPDGSVQLQAIPPDMNAVTPHLVCRDASAAIAFYQQAFEAREMSRLDSPQGALMHACLRIGDSTVMLTDEMPECQARSPQTLGGTPVTIHLYVEDADATFARAVQAGATAVMPPAEMFWGDRYGVVEDPYGHRWSIATHVRDLTPAAVREAAAAFLQSA